MVEKDVIPDSNIKTRYIMIYPVVTMAMQGIRSSFIVVKPSQKEEHAVIRNRQMNSCTVNIN